MNETLTPLEKRDIHLWLAFSDEMTREQLHAHYFSLLSAPELLQQQRFCFAEDRLRYLLTRALVRTVLSRYAPIVPREWRFATNSYGRPHIVNPLPVGADLRFNLSHTRGLIVLAVAQARDIGVDVENTQSRVVSTDIAARFFSRVEADALSRLPPRQRQERFFEYWTFKESYIKARGVGLSIPLDQFSFCYSGERNVQMTTHEALADAPERWQFWQLRPAPEYCLAVCVQRAGTPASQLLVRKIVPAESERAVMLPVLRTSV